MNSQILSDWEFQSLPDWESALSCAQRIVTETDETQYIFSTPSNDFLVADTWPDDAPIWSITFIEKLYSKNRIELP